jgi:hypothetical protein
MALFTDGNISTLENLSGEDTGILDLANTEGIDLSVKLALAQEELAIELGSWLARSRATSQWTWPGDSAALVGPPNLNNIVVTPPLRMWHTFYTLALVYRDAYHNQLNDRYLAKWNEYKEQMRWASGMLFQAGAGLVWDPIPAANAPSLTAVSGTQAATTYFVAIAWLNTRGEEGAAGAAASLTTSAQQVIQATPQNIPGNAKTWNVYAGLGTESLALQNSAPLDVTQVWVEPNTGLVTGRVPGNGQDPNSYRVLPRTLQRG